MLRPARPGIRWDFRVAPGAMRSTGFLEIHRPLVIRIVDSHLSGSSTAVVMVSSI